MSFKCLKTNYGFELLKMWREALWVKENWISMLGSANHGIDEHLRVELEDTWFIAVHWMDVGGREIKVVAEEMNDVSMKGAQGQTRLDGGKNTCWGNLNLIRRKSWVNLEKTMMLSSKDTDYNVRSCKIKGSNKEDDKEMNHGYRSRNHQVKGIIGRRV